MLLQKPKSVKRLRILVSPCISLSLFSIACPVFGNPASGSVVRGDAAIDYGTTTTITQSTDKAIINWDSFSIQETETTKFVQPSASAVTLNRVTGGDPSAIMGSLQANGNIFLINPNGVLFGANAQVNVAGLVASTANIADSDFLAGNYHFTGAPDGSYIINRAGTGDDINAGITITNAGLAALVAPSVTNEGIIRAQLGNVVLASGSDYTLDLFIW